MRLPTCLLAALLLSACGGDPPAPPATYASRCELPAAVDEPYRSTAPTGTQCIGAAEFLVADVARDEPLTASPDDRRVLQVRVLYPARAQAQAPRMPYAADDVYGALDWPAGLRPQGHARRDVPPAVAKPAPVILFSPGLLAPAQVYAGLTEDLASLGYVVVTVNHPYISGPTALPGGGLAVPEPDLEGSEELLEITLADMRTVLAWLERQHGTAGGPLSGKLDLGRIGAYGHSFGGATALQLQRLDPRVKAAVNLDGTVYGDLTQPWTKPWMILQGVHRYRGVPFEEETMQAMWDNRAGPVVLERLPQACHGDFGDVHRLVDAYLARNPGVANALLAEPDLYCAADPEAVEQEVRRKVREFFARFLR